MKLNRLQDCKGARHNGKRKGRGIGSGKGKTAGRGHKGQKSRSGAKIKDFEGGQMPLYRRLPKRGFVNSFRKTWAVVNLGRIQKSLDEGRLDPKTILNAEALAKAGLIGRGTLPLAVLAKGEFRAKNIRIEAERSSKAARTIVSKNNGEIIIKREDTGKADTGDRTSETPS